LSRRRSGSSRYCWAHRHLERGQVPANLHHPPAQDLALRGQSAPLIVGQAETLLPELFSEAAVLLLEILNGPLLVLVHLSGQGFEKNVPGS